jgi:hypothetical protein
MLPPVMGSLLEFENSCGEVRNLNALIDSMIWGCINTLKPPYVVCIGHTAGFPQRFQQVWDGRAACQTCHANMREVFSEAVGQARVKGAQPRVAAY